jgi:hypothetical protein
VGLALGGMPPLPSSPLNCSGLERAGKMDAFIQCMQRGASLNLVPTKNWNDAAPYVGAGASGPGQPPAGPGAPSGPGNLSNPNAPANPGLPASQLGAVAAALASQDFSMLVLAHSIMQNQGQEGACTAYGLVHALIASVKKKFPSYETSADAFWKTYQKATMPAAKTAALNYPFKSDDGRVNISVTEVLPIKDLNALKEAIYVRNLALWAASGVNDSWQLAARGGSSVLKCGSVKGAGHSYVLLGYHDDPKAPGGGYVVVKNSWGKSWGFFGYCFFSATASCRTRASRARTRTSRSRRTR